MAARAIESACDPGLGKMMKRISLAGVFLVVTAVSDVALAADAPTKVPACRGVIDPYKNYACLDAYLGTTFAERLFNYYRLEWGHDVPPADPKAPPGRRAYWPATPEATPPYPFTEWPYGGTTSIGVTRPASIDSPLMTAISNTSIGQWRSEE